MHTMVCVEVTGQLCGVDPLLPIFFFLALVPGLEVR